MYEINGYRLSEPLQAKDAGFSRWAFGNRNGVQYFIKEFIDPVYPDDNTLSDHLRELRIEDCQQFCRDKSALYEAVNRAADGNLVRVTEFFRSGSHYYVSMPRIFGEKLTVEQVSCEPLEQRVLLCATIAHAIMCLHEQGVVHADIKATNILISRSKSGNLVGKIIDYDCGFFESNPPEDGDDLFGDQVYLSPEGCLFINDEDVELTCKMDVFALGLLFHQYLDGRLPVYDTENYDAAYEAVLNDEPLVTSPALPAALQNLLYRMLLADPQERCSAKDAFEVLQAEYLRLTAPVVTSVNQSEGFEGWNPKFRTNTKWFTEGGDL